MIYIKYIQKNNIKIFNYINNQLLSNHIESYIFYIPIIYPPRIVKCFSIFVKKFFDRLIPKVNAKGLGVF